jgi:BMFP domain-containing protein YqiC
MVVSRTELQQVVEQINTKFEELENRIKELEAAEKKKPAKKTTSKAA